MTETDAAADRSSLVPGAHRLIRAIDGKEGPFAGSLVTYEEGVAVCVDVERLGDWPGWAYSDADHVCGVLDIRRRPDGQDALLPWCTARVESFLGRRQIADAPLTAGELGTLVASILRGVRELGTNDVDCTGEWWLTGDGRPVFVHGDGGAPRVRSAALVEKIAAHTTDRATIRVLDDIAAALRRPRHHVEEERRWEEELFAIAAPRALRLDVFAPENAGDINAQRVGSAPALMETRAKRRQLGANARSHRLKELMAAVHERVADAITRLPRPAQRLAMDRPTKESATKVGAATEPQRKPSRPRALLLAGSLGATVLIIGLMWPSDGTDDDAEAAARPREVASSLDEPDPSETTQSEPAQSAAAAAEDSSAAESPTQGAEVMAALPSVLGVLQECVHDGDTSCTGAVTEGARTPSEGVVLLGPDASAAVLVEDYGDVAVVRLTPAESAALEQMLVLEHQNELWLLRDVYDVAKQPE